MDVLGPQALLLGKPGSQCATVQQARHYTFAELQLQVGGVGLAAVLPLADVS
jgi:hypothetical protein